MCVTGEPDAVKAARPVWRGADGKVLRATGVTRRRPTLLSEKTVKNHVANIFSKLQVNDRTQAVLYALR